MNHSDTAAVATGRDIILEIVRSMRENLEPLHYSTLAPAIYHVYLHREDIERLQAIAPRIVDESKRALTEEVNRLNKTSLLDHLGGSRKLPKIAAPEHGWQIDLHENTDDDVKPGDIVIHSDLALPARPDLGAGSMTRRIATTRIGGVQSGPQRVNEAASPATSVYATIRFEDSRGPQVYEMTKDQIVVGRGGQAYWIDLRLDTLPDVSREHLRIRRDPQNGKFFLKDVSQLGTTLNGKPVPNSIQEVNGEKRDQNLEVQLPSSARIGLAGVLFLDFDAKQ